jgi:hypothetical protein
LVSRGCQIGCQLRPLPQENGRFPRVSAGLSPIYENADRQPWPPANALPVGNGAPSLASDATARSSPLSRSDLQPSADSAAFMQQEKSTISCREAQAPPTPGTQYNGGRRQRRGESLHTTLFSIFLRWDPYFSQMGPKLISLFRPRGLIAEAATGPCYLPAFRFALARHAVPLTPVHPLASQ